MWKLFSSETENRGKTSDVYARQVMEVKKVWNGNRYRNFGIERIVMLVLVILPFIDVGLFFRNMFKGEGKLLHRKLFTDFYVVLNLALPVLVLYHGWYRCTLVVWICIYFGFQTIVALLSMAFLYNVIPGAISHKRNLISLFLNFLQFVFLFAILYVSWGENSFGSCGEIVNLKPLQAVYLSFETFTTVGFGDIVPINDRGYYIIIIQMIVQLVFAYIIFTVFSDKIGSATFYNKAKK